MSESKILVVDDEPGIVSNVRAFLERDGYIVQSAADGPSALQLARSFAPDLIVLDIMLPGMDGLEVLRRLRQDSEVYVLMLTARSDETDKLIGLTVGADDYLTKPFAYWELLARINALLRRSVGVRQGLIRVADLTIDPASRRVTRGWRAIDLTTREYEILSALARHAGVVVDKDRLVECIRNEDFGNASNLVEVYISRLRKKIDQGAPVALIRTVRGRGYCLSGELE